MSVGQALCAQHSSFSVAFDCFVFSPKLEITPSTVPSICVDTLTASSPWDCVRSTYYSGVEDPVELVIYMGTLLLAFLELISQYFTFRSPDEVKCPQPVEKPRKQLVGGIP